MLEIMEEKEEKKISEQEENKKEKQNKPEEKDRLKAKQEELDDVTDRYKRILAEFENYKKRSQKERENLYGSILSEIVETILPVLDNLENAAKAETKDEEYKKGVEMVLKQLQDVLKAQGVEEIKALGETFDPEVHEAVSSIQDDTKGEKEIVQEYRKGYKTGSKVIRHSMVVVAN
jgi:molecular chaperone GrpE